MQPEPISPNSSPEPAQPSVPPAPQSAPLPQPDISNPAPQPNPASIYPAQPQAVYGPSPTQPAAPAANPEEEKDFVIAFLLSWLLGGFGADRFYLGYIGTGILKLVTFGGLGIWVMIDIVRLAFGKMKDKGGIPLKGYEQNKTWTRIIAIVHLVIVVLVIVFILITLVFTTKNGVQGAAKDTARRVDINALQGQLEAYEAQNGNYPTLDELNSATFRQSHFTNFPSDALKDPQGTSSVLVSGLAINAYSYQPAPDNCDNQVGNDCTGYTLTAQLSTGDTYSKHNLN